MELRYWPQPLQLTHSWRIARTGSVSTEEVVFLELKTPDGLTGIGEAAPSARYQEDNDSVMRFFKRVDPEALRPDDIVATMRYLNTLGASDSAAKGAINIALLDLLGKMRR